MGKITLVQKYKDDEGNIKTITTTVKKQGMCKTCGFRPRVSGSSRCDACSREFRGKN